MRKNSVLKTIGISAIFVVGGILVNWGCQALFTSFGLKFVFDEWGTIFLSLFGSPLAAGITGFYSRAFQSYSDPNYLYISAQSVILTVLLYWVKRKEIYKSAWKTIIAILLIGIVIGFSTSYSIWVLYDNATIPPLFYRTNRHF